MRKQAATRASRPQHLQPHGKCLRTKKLPLLRQSWAMVRLEPHVAHWTTTAPRLKRVTCMAAHVAATPASAGNPQRLGCDACRRLRSEMPVRSTARSRALTLMCSKLRCQLPNETRRQLASITWAGRMGIRQRSLVRGPRYQKLSTFGQASCRSKTEPT